MIVLELPFGLTAEEIEDHVRRISEFAESSSGRFLRGIWAQAAVDSMKDNSDSPIEPDEIHRMNHENGSISTANQFVSDGVFGLAQIDRVRDSLKSINSKEE